MSARVERRPSGLTNRSQAAQQQQQQQQHQPTPPQSAPAQHPSQPGSARQGSRPPSHRAPPTGGGSAAPPPGTREGQRRGLNTTSGSNLFAKMRQRFTPEERSRQRQLMSEIRDRMAVRHFKMQEAFRELDEDKSGSVDVMEFVNVLRKAHIDLPDKDQKLLFAFADDDSNGRIKYDEFVAALERTGPWGSRYYGLPPEEMNEQVLGLMNKYAKSEFASEMGQRIERGSAGRMRYYHMLDRDSDGYVSKEDFLEGARALNMPREYEPEVHHMFDELTDAQGGDGRLNFPLFGELLTPLPDLTGTGPFGGDYRLKEISAINNRIATLDQQMGQHPVAKRYETGMKTLAETWRYEAGAPNGEGPVAPPRPSLGSTDTLRFARSHTGLAAKGHAERTLEPGSYVVDAELKQRAATAARLGTDLTLSKRKVVPRRTVRGVFNKGTHANLIQPVPEAAMFLPESERLQRIEHFADKWDWKADARKKEATLRARAERRADNEMRVADMVRTRQEMVDFTELARSRALGMQGLWMMERTRGQL